VNTAELSGRVSGELMIAAPAHYCLR